MQLALTGSDLNFHSGGGQRCPKGMGGLGQAQGWPEATERDCRSGQMGNSHLGAQPRGVCIQLSNIMLTSTAYRKARYK